MKKRELIFKVTFSLPLPSSVLKLLINNGPHNHTYSLKSDCAVVKMLNNMSDFVVGWWFNSCLFVEFCSLEELPLIYTVLI